ncbi:hypothetical protein CBS101457_004630 [Exobasidium rhododendri]|nr:hypothetical protein CBS101457_004630 [Exobasidium rhododendri]
MENSAPRGTTDDISTPVALPAPEEGRIATSSTDGVELGPNLVASTLSQPIVEVLQRSGDPASATTVTNEVPTESEGSTLQKADEELTVPVESEVKRDEIAEVPSTEAPNTMADSGVSKGSEMGNVIRLEGGQKGEAEPAEAIEEVRDAPLQNEAADSTQAVGLQERSTDSHDSVPGLESVPTSHVANPLPLMEADEIPTQLKATSFGGDQPAQDQPETAIDSGRPTTDAPSGPSLPILPAQIDETAPVEKTQQQVLEQVTAAKSPSPDVKSTISSEAKAQTQSNPISASVEPVLTPAPAPAPRLASRSKPNPTQAQTPSLSPSLATSAPAPATASAEGSSSATRRASFSHLSAGSQGKARQNVIMRVQKENEDMRLMWLSLPANDHITYYSDTEEDASSSASDVNGMAPIGAYGGLPFLSSHPSSYGNAKRKRPDFLQDDERESSDSADENVEKEDWSEERRFRTGNRGNKLQKGSRWVRRGKLGFWTEAKNEKEMHDRFTSRVKAVQRAGVESLLYNAPGPKAVQEGGALTTDMLEKSDRMLLKDSHSPQVTEENLNSISLAPALLRPILSARALLESHTLRHTFKNPHIGALSKTALDLRESEGQLSRALGRCFSAIERVNAYQDNGEIRINGSGDEDHGEFDSQAIGVEGTNGTLDEVNSAFVQLDQLFITREGLPIPLVGVNGEEPSSSPTNAEMQAVLSVAQQRDVVRAALECLQELGADSLEYVDRLDEVRGRLEAVKRRRTQVWEALRLWAIRRECGPDDDDEEGGGEGEEEEGFDETSGASRLGVKTTATAAPSAPSATTAAVPSRKRR